MKLTTNYRRTARYSYLDELQKRSIELSLMFCGLEECYPLHKFGPNIRKAHMLHIVEDGKGVLEINDQVYSLESGDAFFLEAGVEAYYIADSKEPWTYMWIGVEGIKAKEYFYKAGFSNNTPVRRIGKIDMLKGYIVNMLDEHELVCKSELRRHANLMMLFADLIDFHENSKQIVWEEVSKKISSTYVEQAVGYILNHFQEAIKVTGLANMLGVNRSYLTTIFKQEMECSPQEYLINVRMHHAKILLENSNQTVGEIARAVGYEDQLAFSKAFRKVNGISPSKYKKVEEVLQIDELDKLDERK